VILRDFTAAFDLGQPTTSHHLAKLRGAGIETSFKRGIWAFYSSTRHVGGGAFRGAVDALTGL
jgi:DNA-binding transcriptional ArsR family regulator